ncbi:adenylate/guanylate cyclase domain-containing protein [Leptospira ognonensis]|uniref:Adenylate/guanylate cyclase domain-containing protein n=1 Tax=Leptospira ognonensis TaxID=2484945 RepID=A0A4R9K6H1_9LEPT|nr:adenylate/guanylate cyclase domain-containing protein [Leptospira ognonensis]TGL60167.1 adenylate/guanylate cyclase domain-containing protein [Leptospira ognonensis]
MNQNSPAVLFDSIRAFRSWSPGVVERLESIIENEDDYTLFRINPYTFAAAGSFDEEEVLELFLHASKSGLLVMEWLLICPRCGDPVNNFKKLMHVHNRYHCEFCRRDYETNLDDSILVCFTIHPDIRKIRFHNPTSLTISEYQYKYHFSREGKIPGTQETITNFFKLRERFLGFLEPGEQILREIVAEEGYLEGNDFLHHTDFLIEVTQDAQTTPEKILITFENENVTSIPTQIKVGKHRFEIINKSDKKIPLSIYQLDGDFMTSEFNLDFDKFLSAKVLLNHRAFRSLFKGEDIVGSTGLSIKDVTVLFTDLKGSTNLYERIGDLKAFSLVQQHFDEVGQVIGKHKGALIKTIGDAIMATFLTPLDAILAANEMLDVIHKFNARQLEKEIILKIGIHAGASIAVMLNERLDYFGQIINIAARVQGIAEGEEICFTKEIYDYPGVKEIFQNKNLKEEDVSLKGIKNPITIYRIGPSLI